METHFVATRQSTLRGWRAEIEYHENRIAVLEKQCEELEQELMINAAWADRTERDLTNKNIRTREEEANGGQ